MGSPSLDDTADILDPSFDWSRWHLRLSYWASHAEGLEHARLVQTEVYFGFLRCLIGPLFQFDDFIDDWGFVSLVKLPGILLRIGKVSFEKFTRQDFQSSQELLDTAWDRNSTSSTALNSVKLSLVALPMFLAAFWGEFDRLGFLRLRPTLRDGGNSVEHMQTRLLSSGWCPYWIGNWGCRFSSLFLHYLSGLGPGKTELANTAKKQCTSFSCYCDNVNEDGYLTKHSATCSVDQCHFEGPEPTLISDTVGRGKIPLVKMTRRTKGSAKMEETTRTRWTSMVMLRQKQSGRVVASWRAGVAVFDLQIVEYEPKQHEGYIAISHVWRTWQLPAKQTFRDASWSTYSGVPWTAKDLIRTSNPRTRLPLEVSRSDVPKLQRLKKRTSGLTQYAYQCIVTILTR